MNIMKTYEVINVLSIVFFLKVVVVQCDGIVFDEDPSESCTLNSGAKGTCKSILECPSEFGSLLSSQPKTCGFLGNTPIVCCPLSTDTLISGNTSAGTVTSPGLNFQCGFKPVGIHGFLRQKRAQAVNAIGKFSTIRPVVGGIDAFVNDWPWMALIGDGAWFCDGALINREWVISAAHCFLRRTPTIVRLGELNFLSGDDGARPIDIDVDSFHLHPDYTPVTAYHDLALLKLKTTVGFQSGNISPVCLPWDTQANRDLVGKKVTLTGWGAKEFGGSSSPILQVVKVTVFDTSICDENYKTLHFFNDQWPQGITKETTICAGDPEGGKDACHGDSGGPIIYTDDGGKYTLAGIVSKGYGCGSEKFPGLYSPVNIPKYLSWIKTTAF